MRTNGIYWTPRSKRDLIGEIVKSGKWNDTQAKLKAMEIRQIRGIFHSIRQAQFNSLMRFDKQSAETNLT